MFLKPRKTDSLLGYYKRECTDKNLKIVMKIIDNICVNRYDNMTQGFERQIIEFTDEFKKERPEYFKSHQDAIVFRLYSEITKKNIKLQKDKIHSGITDKQKETAINFTKKIFSLNTEIMAVASVGMQTYAEHLEIEDDLNTIVEYVLYSGAGVILFYFMHNKAKHAMGFIFKNDTITEIPKSQLQILAKVKDVTFTQFSEIKK